MGYPAFATAPSYGPGGLAGVLPRILASLGVGADTCADLPEAESAVVVLVDGLGQELLAARAGHAPFLRGLMQRAESSVLTAGFPSTTATSMGSFGTGCPPGVHGLVGYQVRDPCTGLLVNELSWQNGPDPLAWQPQPTCFQRAAGAGLAVTMIAPKLFDGSGLTRAALRGARVRAADPLDERVDLALAALRDDRRALVYLYWGDIDRVGHKYGCGSTRWGEALEELDRGLQRLAAALPAGTSLSVTADHGMVDIPMDARTDLAQDAELDDGVQLTGGEMRAMHLYCRPGAATDVLATWRARWGEQAWVLPREEAIAAGLFGPDVHQRVRPRIGDVLAIMAAPVGVTDSRVMVPHVLRLIGQHGSLTPAEQHVPFLHLPVP